MSKARNPANSPSKYKPEYALIARKMCELGAVDQEMADAFGIGIATFYRWRNQHPDFCEALKLGKEPVDDRVENALYHRAVGFSHDDVDLRVINGKLVKTPIKKYFPPDTKAAIAWLSNRRRDKWQLFPTSGENTADNLAAALASLAEKLPN